MRIHLLAVGRRMPDWVEAGWRDYALRLVEIESGHRGKGASIEAARREEGERQLAAIPKGAQVVALDAAGTAWSTEQLAAQLARWLADGRDIALLVGGPDGLADECLTRAERCWSLSPLTFPHALVRVILAEQLYRALSLLKGHPYHRA